MNDEKDKVFVGMSGGVDSSVSAALLRRDGYDVTGVFIKVWQADFLQCTWREERRDAMRACAHLGIPFFTLDLEKEYKEGVVDYMISEYSAGRIPNPDVMCNKHVKFGAFLEYAKKHGADFIATGHYARIDSRQQSQVTSKHRLLVGVDKEKDQSYFLWTLTQEQLAHTLFPVGGLEKCEVRKLAKEFGLLNAEKKDSQGLCFMGPVNIKDFLAHYVRAEVGKVLSQQGEVVGEHDGALFYTIGQRHGFRTNKHAPQTDALYVISKDMERNTITVGPREHKKIQHATISIGNMNVPAGVWSIGERTSCKVRVRYRGALDDATLTMTGADEAKLEFTGKSDDAIAPGQSAVLYLGEECLGGGIIKSL